MPATYKDMDILRQNTTFQGRVRAAIISGSITVGNENSDTTPYHRERVSYCSQIMNNPDAFAPLFASAAATDATVISLATGNGSVVLDGTNAETRQALITDAAITSAVGTQFNAFFRRPA